MAANRFASLLHKRTNRITLVLVYAFLEWSLIFFILLHSLFSYFILRFADYFGLKRPCLFCSRLDRFFDASGNSPSLGDLLCHDHALQLSKPKPKGFREFQNDLSCCVELETNLIGIVEQDKEVNIDEEFSSFECNKEVVAREKEEEHIVDLAMEAETSDEPVAKSLEFYIDDNDCHLIPVQFFKPTEEVREISDVNGDFILDFVGEKEDGGLKSVAFTSHDQSKPVDIAANLDLLEMLNDEETVSIGTEIPDHKQIGDIPCHKHIPNDGDGHEEDTLEFRATTETMRPVLSVNEERFLQTQDLMESSHSLKNAMFRLDRRGSGTESLDGLECSEGGILTVDKLKSELQEERKANNALYEELEEERSASAIAADETMAMINRLQEEKAAMQMEALQYQRMMEEQSEFDQEALQLMNEVMVKREKENAELEKELDLYRRKLEEYEAKEKMGMSRRRKSNSSVDSDENNGELQHKNIEGVNDVMENMPVDVVLSLDECLDDYEGERLSILGRLKFLEEKLTELNDEEDEEEVKMFGNHGCINGNGQFHGKETNGKHRVLKSKRLLPLFDAVDGEMENGNHQENGVYDSENGEIVTVEEEVDDLYERLEALEADREFLRRCVGSLKKGDKGVHLLNEILQHLRDLKNIDLIHIRENEDLAF